MIRAVCGSQVAVKKWFGVLAGRPIRKARRSKPIGLPSSPPLLLAIEQLECRITPVATLVATSFFDSAVYEFNSSTGALTSTLVAPYSSALLSGPAGMTLGPDGNVYLSSQFNNAILQYNLATATLSTFIPSTVLQPIAMANMDSQFAPSGIRFGPDGNLYVSLNGGQSAMSGGAVVRFDMTATAGALSYNGTSATIATGLIQPSGLTFGTALGDTNNLYVSNSAAQDVIKVANASSASPTSSTFIASGSGGLSFPTGLTWGPDGKLYVVDLGATSFQGNVLQFNPDGSFSKVMTPTGAGQPGNLLLQFPADILFDGQGHFLTANLGASMPPALSGSINQYNTDGSFAQTLVSSSQFPNTGTGTSGISPSQLALIPPVNPGPFAKYNVAVQGPSTMQAGNNFLVTVQAADAFGMPVTSYSGPSTVTATISPTSTASSFPTTVSINPQGLGYFLADLQKVGTYTITAANGSFTGSAAPVTITPGPGVKLAFGAQPVNTPTGVTLPPVTVQALDTFGNVVTSDNSDSVTVGVASGPGTFTAGSTTTATVQNGVATFSNLTLVNPGSYTLSELVPSQFTGPSSTAFTVAPLQVLASSFAGTPSGFSLSFNAPFLVNSTTPVLYGQGFGATGPVPSVTLTGPTGPVEGSLVLNTAANSLTFVETDTASVVNNSTPILPDGTYTVDVRSSGATGLQALNSGGGYLDGHGTGVPGSGDFTATFTVNAAAAGEDVVWVPPTADGPGQALNAPGGNQTGGGYPVYLSDTHGSVNKVQVTLNYNPALLTVTGVTGTGFSLLPSSTPGQANLQYSGAALPMGTSTLGFVTATVPSGTAGSPMPYKAKDLLHLSNVVVSTGGVALLAFPATTGDALHLVAYVGDADGNGSYSSNDAVLITRVALQTDTGFTAYPLVDPVVVADTDGSGFIPADAPLQVNEAGVGFPTANLSIPPIPTGVVFVPIGNNVDPSISLPSDLHIAANGTVTVPVNIDDAHPAGSTGLTAAHLALTYDPRAFTVSPADVHLGSVLAAGSGWSVIPTINPITGEIAIALSSSTPIGEAIGGTLVSIDLHPTGVISGLAAIELVASVNPSGHQVVLTELEDAQGTFTLTPAPRNGFDPQINSVVTLGATPTPVPVRILPAQSTATGEAIPVETAEANNPVQALPSEPVNPSLTTAADASETGVSAVSGTAADAGSDRVSAAVRGATVVAATSATTLAATPLVGLAFQVASTSLVSNWALPSITAGQRLADQFFQTLVQGKNSPSDATPTGTVKEALERIMPGQLLRLPGDKVDSLIGEEASSALDWQALADTAWLVAYRAGRTTAAVSEVIADQTALDHYFAEAANDNDGIMDE